MSKHLHVTRLPLEERRQATLVAARKVFSRSGFAGARSSEIAREAGISEAMVFKLFGDKDGLYQAILEDQIAAVPVDDLPQEAAAAGDAVAVFRGTANAIVQAVRRDPCFYRLLFSSALEAHPLSTAFAASRIDRLVTFLADFIVDQQRAEVFRRADARATALAFMGMIHQFLQVREIFDLPGYEDLDGERYRDEVVDLVIRGLCLATDDPGT